MTIHLHLRDKSPARKAIREAIPSPYHPSIVEHIEVKKQEIPRRADFVLHCGQARPTTAAEGFAASKGSFIACLPEAMSWFQRKLADHVGDVVILDASLHKVTRVM